jgi:hypothetical protein
LVQVRFVGLKEETESAPETYKLVVVALVVVTLVKIAVEGFVSPMVIPLMVPPARVTDGEESAPKAPTLALAVEPVAVVKRRVVAKRSVEVALVVVV